MDYMTIRDKIVRRKLVDMLGATMAGDICRKAGFAAAKARDEREKLELFLSSTCDDPKFIGMWGTAQAARQKEEWLNLYR